jgi:hypothetical protein
MSGSAAQRSHAHRSVALVAVWAGVDPFVRAARVAETDRARRGLASWTPISNTKSFRHPVTVTHLPVVRCQICRRTVAYRGPARRARS